MNAASISSPRAESSLDDPLPNDLSALSRHIALFVVHHSPGFVLHWLEIRQQRKLTRRRFMVDDFEALSTIVEVLRERDPDEQKRILQSVLTFLNIELDRKPKSTGSGLQASDVPDDGSFSQDRTLSPKEFLLDKNPQTDVERVVCLAYYLTHYRDTPHFKTVDISTLNTEAAQRKFSNAAKAVDNATRQAGYLVQATKGNKQISATGERFVELLPDREAAREAVRTYQPRKKSKKKRPQRRSKVNAT